MQRVCIGFSGIVLLFGSGLVAFSESGSSGSGFAEVFGRCQKLHEALIRRINALRARVSERLSCKELRVVGVLLIDRSAVL